MENNTGIIIYQTEDGKTRVDVRVEDETVWLSQASIAELYQTTPQNITLHIKNIYDEKELDEQATCKYFLQVQNEGNREVKRNRKFYNLEMIIAIGYRVRSHIGTHFRRWATERLNEYMIKGFTMNDERLKEMRNLGQDYFDELLERIRDIRASEKRFYKKITDIFALSIDYDPNTEVAKEFFATVQNKLHWAIHGHTAAELIAERADANKPNMGLTTWKGDKVRKGDVTTAKNYLSETELKSLNRIVTMYLDYAEDQAQQHKVMHMKDWEEKLNLFLQFNGREVLTNAGKISSQLAHELAYKEYDKYNQQRLMENNKDDFDRFLEESEYGGKKK